MATHSSVLDLRIPGMGEPGGLPFLGSHRVGHDCSTLYVYESSRYPRDIGTTGQEVSVVSLREMLEDQIANISRIIKEAREKNIYFCFIDYAKAFDCVDHNKLWKILKEMRIPDHLTCLLRNLYAGQEATVRTGHVTTDWFQIWKGVCQGCILSPCLFNLYAEYIMRNGGLDEAQAGIKIAGRNINNLKYADDTNLWQKVKKN